MVPYENIIFLRLISVLEESAYEESNESNLRIEADELPVVWQENGRSLLDGIVTSII